MAARRTKRHIGGSVTPISGSAWPFRVVALVVGVLAAMIDPLCRALGLGFRTWVRGATFLGYQWDPRLVDEANQLQCH